MTAANAASLFAEADRIGRLASEALLAEAEATPKPGLVDSANPGAHRDMDIDSFRQSASALAPFFAEFVRQGLAQCAQPAERCLAGIRPLGLDAERAMLRATGGVNTHKGAIFLFGILCCSAGRLLGRGEALSVVALCAESARVAAPSLAELSAGGASHGLAAYRCSGASGARGEAADGFPHVRSVSLPVYRALRKENVNENDALCHALMQLIAAVDDTNALARGGAAGAAYAKRAAADFLSAHGADVGTTAWRNALAALDADFTARGLTHGGCADLTAVTWFLSHFADGTGERPPCGKERSNMEKGNILVIGNSGVGKSTLINAVLGRDCAVTGFGTAGTTKELKIYENEDGPFRVIDTVGFEPSLLKERAAVGAVKKWSKASAAADGADTRINVIWFCVEGTSSKLFPKAIKNLARATSMWPSVPIIVVITKSYSVPERERNIEMVHRAFATQKRCAKNLRQVIPVVAATYALNDSAFAPPEGISELIDATNALLPEGIQAAADDIAAFKLGRKRALAHSVVAAAAAGAAVVGAVPIPFSDALILGPVELAEVNALAQIYGINKSEKSKQFLSSIVEVGTVGIAAKALISALKAIPVLNLGAAAINAVTAGSIVAALGEGSILAFEQVYLGKKSTDDIDWVKKLIESKLSAQFIDKAKAALAGLADKTDEKSVAGAVLGLFAGGEDDKNIG